MEPLFAVRMTHDEDMYYNQVLASKQSAPAEKPGKKNFLSRVDLSDVIFGLLAFFVFYMTFPAEELAQRIEAPEAGARYIFDEKKALRPIEFIERFCKHSKGEWAGKPVTLELFQKAFISALFGFVDRETGLRQCREAMFYVARKNGKSTMLAGIALYMMIADREAGAEIYCVATKRDQARLIFEEAYNMIKQSPQLRELVRKRKGDFPVTLQPVFKNSVVKLPFCCLCAGLDWEFCRKSPFSATGCRFRLNSGA